MNTGNVTRDLPSFQAQCSHLMGIKRYAAILHAHAIENKQLASLLHAICDQLQASIHMGSKTVIDETIYEYFGQDIRDDGVDIKIEEKPHPYGALNYLAVQELPHSGKLIIVDLEPCLIDNKPTPRHAMLRLAERINAQLRSTGHYLCDSIFMAAKSLQEFDHLDAGITVALSKASSCGLQHLLAVGEQDLPAGFGRTFQRGKYIAQLRQMHGHITAVVTTSWQCQQIASETQQPILSYTTAQCLFEHESMSAVATAFHLPRGINVGDPVKVILAATGHNISLPAPDQQGCIQINEETLSTMKLAQLRLLHQQTPQCKTTSKKNKQELINDILRRHPDAKPKTESLQHLRATSALRASLLSQTTPFTPIVDQYSSQYGWVDRVNRSYYQHFHPAGHRTWKKLYLMSVMFGLIQNAWGFYCEHQHPHEAQDKPHQPSQQAAAQDVDLTAFIRELCSNIDASQ